MTIGSLGVKGSMPMPTQAKLFELIVLLGNLTVDGVQKWEKSETTTNGLLKYIHLTTTYKDKTIVVSVDESQNQKIEIEGSVISIRDSAAYRIINEKIVKAMCDDSPKQAKLTDTLDYLLAKDEEEA